MQMDINLFMMASLVTSKGLTLDKKIANSQMYCDALELSNFDFNDLQYKSLQYVFL